MSGTEAPIGTERVWAISIALALVVLAEAVVLYVGVFRHGEVITSSALGYGMAPWKGRMPTTDRPLRGNPVLSDDLMLFTPWDHTVRDAVADGRLPVRTDWSGCGMPLLANNQAAVLAPAQSLRWLWPSPRARTFGLLLVAPIAAFGAFVLFRLMGLSATVSAFGALSWSHASLFTVWLMYPLAETAAWFPWVLAGIRGTLDEDRSRARKFAVLLAISVGAILLAGHLPTAVQFLTATSVAASVWLALNSKAWRHVLRLVPPLAIGLLLACPQLVPFTDYLLVSEAVGARGGGNSAAAASVSVDAAWNWLVPRGFGSPERFGYTGPSNFNEAVSSVGLTVLTLGLAAPFLARGRLAMITAGGLVAACATAYGLPPFPWLVARLPLVGLVQAGRWTLVAQWCLVVLATLAVHRLLSDARSRRDVLAAGAFVVAGFLAVLRHPALAGEADPHATIAAGEVLFAAGEAAVIGVALLVMALGRARIGLAVLIALVVASGLRLGWGFNPTIAPEAIPGRNAAAARLSELAGDGRVLTAGWVMLGNTGALAGVRTVRGSDAMGLARAAPLLRHAAFEELETVREPSAAAMRLARRTGATAIATDHELVSAGLTRVAGFDEPLRVYSVERSHPALGWYPESVEVADIGEAVAALAAGKIAETVVTVEAGPDADSSPPSSRGRSWDAPLHIPHRRVHAARFEATASFPGQGWLVLREAAHPGWRVRLDGRAVRWRIADGMFVGVPVPEGPHVVEFVYRPRHMGLAWGVAGLGLAGVIALGWAARRRRVTDRCRSDP